MQAQPFLPRPCSLCHGLKKRMMGPHSFGSSPAQAARPAHSAQPAGRGGAEDRASERVGANASSKPHRSAWGEIIPEIKSWARSLQDVVHESPPN